MNIFFVWSFMLISSVLATTSFAGNSSSETPSLSVTFGAAGADGNPSESDFSIVRAEFGLFNSSESGEPVFTPSRTVPLIDRQEYGWIIFLDTKKTKIRWREEFSLPSAPSSWGEGETQGFQTISRDRKVSVTEREVMPDRGVLFNSWRVVPGDPAGRYVIRVIIENRVEHIFEFDVR